jgi:hypothetical protein
MQTNNSAVSSEDPPWLKSPPKEERQGRRSAAGGANGGGTGTGGADSGSRLTTPLSSGRGRQSYGNPGYDSAEEDDDANYNEDCCCCPMDPILLGITFFHGICFVLGLAGVAVHLHHLTRWGRAVENAVTTDGSGSGSGSSSHSSSSGSDISDSYPGHHHSLKELFLRCYDVVFCLLIIVCETDWRFVMKRLRLLDLWMFRGLFYIYIGLQTLEVQINGDVDLETLSDLDNMVGCLLVLAGVSYLCLGACCIKSVAEAKRRQLQMLDRPYREVQDVEMESV